MGQIGPVEQIGPMRPTSLAGEGHSGADRSYSLDQSNRGDRSSVTDRSCRDWYACGDPAGKIGLEERIGLASGQINLSVPYVRIGGGRSVP